MEQDLQLSPFVKAILTALFVGIIDSVVCLTYNIVYRDFTGFTPSVLINVSSLIFVLNLLFLVIGFIYFFFLKTFKKGDLVFIGVFVLFTIFCLLAGAGVNRSANTEINRQFRGLLSGIIIIVGISASFLVPVLFHSKKFERTVL